MTYPSTLPATLIFLSILIFSFFPSLIVPLLQLPFHLSPRKPTAAPPPTMSFYQTTFTLPPSSKGSYLVTPHVTSALSAALPSYKVGLLHLFVQHTSCALSLNENWDEDVRSDMTHALDRIVPEDQPGGGGKKMYRHSAEGKDDMPVSFGGFPRRRVIAL